jgi:hypothetical protein
VSEKHLHIVCLDVPYPPDYGGAMEMFYKIKALHDLGIRIHLHCFEYGRGQQPELNKYCEEVLYYQRHEGHKGFSLKLPYIVCSRNNHDLQERLQQDDYPILLEGVHTTALLHQGMLKHRKVLIRLHNIEHEYYKHLSKYENNLIKKIYFINESRLLYKYEKELSGKAIHLAITRADEEKFRRIYKNNNVAFLPAFVPSQLVTSNEGMGNFCLYHGNLSVAENEKAAMWLLKKVFNDIEVPLVIAGKNPSKKLNHAAHLKKHTCLVANPAKTEMDDLIAKAHINIIPSFNSTGIKFKLLHALYSGKHCLVNEETVNGTGLETACHIAGNANAFKSVIVQLYHKPFTEDEIILRNHLLQQEFDNQAHAKRLIAWLY